MHLNTMLFAIIILFCCLNIMNAISPYYRIAKAKIIRNSRYIVAYHLHALGTFPSSSLHNCIYQCQNNDYCRTANYFDSNQGTMCSLFEENSFVGQIVISTTMSIIISFNLCPPGYNEPEYICFGTSINLRSPITVQNVLNNLRLIKQFSILTYYPVILPTKNAVYFPLEGQTTIQQYDWPSLTFVSNIPAGLVIDNYDIDVWGTLLLSKYSGGKEIRVTGSFGNWSVSNMNYYTVFISDIYVVSILQSSFIIPILNITNGRNLFNCTVPVSIGTYYWSRIINHQLYITSTTGLWHMNITQGGCGIAIKIVSSLQCKEIFVDASGRLYVEKDDLTKNNSLVFDLYGTQLASFSYGSKLIVKASKYDYYVMNNRENPLQIYVYP
ncbi:hypothetical protein I4U23_005403 [Adineta vaga]|nr:hypothetical protein I4U23_005403 [Adineta vaga]